MNTQTKESDTNDPITVLGHHVRTDGAASQVVIPALWKDMQEKNLLADVPGRISPDVYAVYTNLEQSGRSNQGWFSFIIGAAVDPSTPVPEGTVIATIPSSPRRKFVAPENDTTRITEAWQEAWASDDAAKTFICEFELYSASGEVSVNLGVRAD